MSSFPPNSEGKSNQSGSRNVSRGILRSANNLLSEKIERLQREINRMNQRREGIRARKELIKQAEFVVLTARHTLDILGNDKITAINLFNEKLEENTKLILVYESEIKGIYAAIEQYWGVLKILVTDVNEIVNVAQKIQATEGLDAEAVNIGITVDHLRNLLFSIELRSDEALENIRKKVLLVEAELGVHVFLYQWIREREASLAQERDVIEHNRDLRLAEISSRIDEIEHKNEEEQLKNQQETLFLDQYRQFIEWRLNYLSNEARELSRQNASASALHATDRDILQFVFNKIKDVEWLYDYSTEVEMAHNANSLLENQDEVNLSTRVSNDLLLEIRDLFEEVHRTIEEVIEDGLQWLRRADDAQLDRKTYYLLMAKLALSHVNPDHGEACRCMKEYVALLWGNTKSKKDRKRINEKERSIRKDVCQDIIDAENELEPSNADMRGFVGKLRKLLKEDNQ